MLFLIIFSLTSCGSFETKDDNLLQQDSVDQLKGFLGGISVDEPRAAMVGEEILLAGGSAIDAAVSAYFVLSVTKPSAASLGGGGICLVRDSKSNKVEMLDFRSTVPNMDRAQNIKKASVPGNAFGFFALHAKYGSLKWGQLIRPAENLARFGFKVSRSLSQDLHMAAPILKKDPDARKIFFDKDSDNIRIEGDFIRQTELSAVLSLIRSKGAIALYQGPNARQFTEAIKQTGALISYEDLRKYRPNWTETIQIPFLYGTTLHFPRAPGVAGLKIAQSMAMLIFNNLYGDGDKEERAHLIAEVLERSLSDSKRREDLKGISLNSQQLVSQEYIKALLDSYESQRRVITPGARAADLDPTSHSSGTSLAVVDASGSAVACSLSMNRPFGAGRIAQGTGIFLSSYPGEEIADRSLVSIILDNKIGKNIYYASAASGGTTAPSALINVAIDSLVSKNSNLIDAVAMKRVHHGGADGITYVERGIPAPILDGLIRRGHRLAYVNSMGLVNAIFCKSGVPRKNVEDVECAVAADPRGYGLSKLLN